MSSISQASLMRRALLYAKMFDRVIMQHCQVPELTEGGVMNEGFESTKLARGFPRTCPVLTTKVSLLLGLLHGRRRFASRAFDYAAERYCDLRAC